MCTTVVSACYSLSPWAHDTSRIPPQGGCALDYEAGVGEQSKDVGDKIPQGGCALDYEAGVGEQSKDVAEAGGRVGMASSQNVMDNPYLRRKYLASRLLSSDINADRERSFSPSAREKKSIKYFTSLTIGNRSRNGTLLP